MLPDQPEPVFHLAFAALTLHLVLQREGIGVERINLQHVPDFLQGQRKLIFFNARPGAFEQLPNRALTNSLVNLRF